LCNSFAQRGDILAELAHFLRDVVAPVGGIAGVNLLGADVDLLGRDREFLEPELPANDHAEDRQQNSQCAALKGRAEREAEKLKHAIRSH
jgi:hypothetical protein